jgi:hypothetical protein
MDITAISKDLKEESKNLTPTYALNIISIIFLFDDYLLCNGLSLQNILLQSNTQLVFHAPIFFIACFAIFQGLPILRPYFYVLAYLVLTYIDKKIGSGWANLITETTKADYLKSQASVLRQAYQENNMVKYNLYLNALNEQKEYENFQNSLFRFAIILSVNYYFTDSILRLGIPGIISKPCSIIFISVVIMILWKSLFRKDFYVYQP